jgi:hypothetical protein
VGPSAGLDAVVRRKIPSPCWDSNPRSSSPLPSAVSLNYPDITTITTIATSTTDGDVFILSYTWFGICHGGHSCEVVGINLLNKWLSLH